MQLVFECGLSTSWTLSTELVNIVVTRREAKLGNTQRRLLGLPLDDGTAQSPSRHRLTQPSTAKAAASQPAKSPLGPPNV